MKSYFRQNNNVWLWIGKFDYICHQIVLTMAEICQYGSNFCLANNLT